jgi:hypothetical protein
MLEYKTLNDNWYFNYINIPNLEIIQKELIELRAKFNKDGSTYKAKDRYWGLGSTEFNIEDHCPVLSSYLKDVGILSKFQWILFNSEFVEEPNLFSPFGKPPIHIDSYDPSHVQFSLNLPLVDCEESYFAWFSTKKKKLVPSTYFDPSLNAAKTQALAFQHDCTEIKRIECNRPILLNATILHKAFVYKKTRVIAGIRFYPNLDIEDMKRLGIAQPLVQTD